MKKGLKILLSVFAFIYFAIIIVITGFLLCYNQYKITVINDNTFLLIDDKSEKYADGDLVVVKKNPNSEIKVNDEILFYDIEKGKVTINSGNVTETRVVNEEEMTFTVNNTHDVSSQAVVGKTSSAKVYPVLGKLLYIVESRFGFLLFVIFPALLFFFYEAYRLIQEIRNPGVDEDVEEKAVEKEMTSSVLESEDTINSDNTGSDSISIENEVSETRKALAEQSEDVISNSLEEKTDTVDEKNSDVDLPDMFNSSSESDESNSSETDDSSSDIESLF